MSAVITGTLYLVATPIGNLADIGHRAIEVLQSVDIVAAEDTRHSRKLLQHYQIERQLIALHEHNERESASRLLEKLQAGVSIALISDAGTPLISDPGFNLVRLVREHGISVVPVPGACALICALSASGLPTDRFTFEGFLPSKSSGRCARLNLLTHETRTMIFYESNHRIVESLQDMAEIFGGNRQAVLARELTKQFETIRGDTLSALVSWVSDDTQQQKGEIVVLVHGKETSDNNEVTPEAEQMLKILMDELPIKQAAKLAAKLCGIKKRSLYEKALELKDV